MSLLPSRPASAWLIALGAFGLLGAAGCAQKSETRACAGLDAGVPVDPALLAFLSHARSAHARADQLEDDAQPAGAIRELERVVHGPLPPDGTRRPEVREVLADTRARLADLRSRQGSFDDAERDVKAGLELARERSYFRGHLFEMRGLTEQRRHDQLEKDGDASGAAAAKLRALDAFEEAMRIQQEVIQRAVPAGSAPPTAPEAGR